MAQIVIISGSPAAVSRSAALSAYIREKAEASGYTAEAFAVRDLPPEDLVYARWDSPAIQEAQAAVAEAGAVILVGPVYKASYPGVLKAFLDLIPEKGLSGKILLPIATGGTVAHLLSLEYAYKPLLSVLGAREFIDGVYLLERQLAYQGHQLTFLDAEAEQRLLAAVEGLLSRLQQNQ
ncbi:NADPH-dependent FMN reductase [Ectobacillus ponti]|uniref:NADPH-dependent FMN reductase n=1 Tax=Ectobacillus ponti TaxID=2961894 RepID=A0AA41X1F6_9BACI|nr:NADPH-dependent FMN reductase [Ectobacillus ponti]MCP8967214.1 NADPH-dependent FMN reductase [Ectobacillus ponti]